MRNENFITQILARVDTQPERLALTELSDFDTLGEQISYADLERRIRSFAGAAELLAAPGGRVIVAARSTIETVSALLGVMLSGRIAVPVSPGSSRYAREVVARIAADCEPSATFDDRGVNARLLTESNIPALGRANALELLSPPELHADYPAFIQYTSGSTQEPKGVVVTHGALTANTRSIQGLFGVDSHSRLLCWLPLSHDMGFVGNVLQGLASGAQIYLASPSAFARDPLGWVRAISHWRITHSGGPSAAYDAAARAATGHDIDTLKLSGWSVAYCGAEPISAAALDNFAATFVTAGFDPGRFLPCYGMAEATLLLSGRFGLASHVRRRDDSGDRRRQSRVTSVGKPVDCEVRIVGASKSDPVGEVVVRGPSLFREYWGRPPRVDEWFPTGDRGYMRGGELHVVGRGEDVVFVGGRNLFTVDLESYVSDGILSDYQTLVTAVVHANMEVELWVETSDSVTMPAERVAAELAKEFQVIVIAVHFCRPGRVPRTTSGKPRRGALKQLGSAAVRQSRISSIQDSLRQLGVSRESGTEMLADAGLTSLGAVRLAQSLRDIHGVTVSVADLLQRWTFSDLDSLISVGSAVSDDARRAASSAPSPTAERRRSATEEEPSFELTETEQSMAFLDYVLSDSDRYVLNFAAVIMSEIEVERFIASAEAELLRHPHLAWGVTMTEEGFRFIPSTTPEGWWTVDHRSLNGVKTEDELAEAIRLVGLNKGDVPTRITLWQTPMGFILQVKTDHVRTDQWGLLVLLRAIVDRYLNHSSLTVSRDSKYQQRYLESAEADPYLARLRDRFAEVGERAEIYVDGVRQAGRAPERVDRIRTVIEGGCDATTPEVVAAWLLTLSAFSDGVNVATGIPVAGRFGLNSVDSVALHTNTLPVAKRIDGDQLVLEFVSEIGMQVYDAVDNGSMPLSRVVREINPPRRPGREPLFDSLVTVHSEPVPGIVGSGAMVDPDGKTHLEVRGIRFRALDTRALAPRAELDITVLRGTGSNDSIIILDYARDLFSENRARSILSWFERTLRLLREARGEATLRVRDLDTEPYEQKVFLSRAAHSNTGPLRRDIVTELRRLRGSRHPALEYHGGIVSFAQLVDRIDILSSSLRLALGHSANEPGRVALLLPSSPAFVTAMFACWASERSVVPIPDGVPTQRMLSMLEDAQIDTIITSISRANEQPPEWDGDVILLDEDGSIEGQSHAELDSRTDAQELRPSLDRDSFEGEAFVVYTSGSTGQPKGAAISHNNLSRHIQWFRDVLHSSSATRIAQTLSLGFDFGLQEIFTTVPFGATLVIPSSKDRSSPRRYAEFLRRENVTVLFSTPTLAAQLASAGVPLRSLRHILLGGEVLRDEVVTAVRRVTSEDCVILNGYGPTECTVNVLVHEVTETASRTGIVPVGEATSGASIFIKDGAGMPRPLNVPGEITIGGPGVISGYLNRPDQTASRFDFTAGRWLYRTGDVAYWDDDGRVVVVGRNDRQVKIDGFRVELDEVQREASTATGGRFVHVDAVGSPPRLVCFVAPETDTSYLAKRLQAVLPRWALPSQYVSIRDIPKTPNGKLDAARLHAVALDAWREPLSRVETHEELRRVVQAAWSRELGGGLPGFSENVFDRGAHSLAAMKVHDHLQSRLGREFPPYFLFEYPTADQLTTALLMQNREET